ncbi:MAG: hypothetical protein F6J89_01175 [Symploca sp. SIO1C4]|uniref:Transposase n=1 Tax=Symploca sp. SIO1C4 TaxID=2607765 RepID=A0A6B3N459_9CYAN|nr:hypothetical protein [Symploca sp. SIO1C4]
MLGQRQKLKASYTKVTVTDDFNAGTFKLKGTRDLNWYTKKQIKRVRIVRLAKGYFVQFCIDVEHSEPLPRTNFL